MDIIECRKKLKGLWGIKTKTTIKDSYSLSLVYTPGVGQVCLEIKDDPKKSFELTNRANTIAILTDGSNFSNEIDPLSIIPSAETKALYYKEYAGIDAFPVVLNTQDTDEIVQAIKNLKPTFAGFDLGDFAPEKSSVMEKSLQHLGLPVYYSYRNSKLCECLAKTELVEEIDTNMILPAVFRAILDSRAKNISDDIFEAVFYSLKIAKGYETTENFDLAQRIVYNVAKTVLGSEDASNVADNYRNFLYEGNKAFIQPTVNNYKSSEHTIAQNSIELHRRAKGVIETSTKLNIKNPADYEKFYSKEQTEKVIKTIREDNQKAYELTPKGNLVAVISDGSAVLGLGNIGPEAAMPVMEGKCALFKDLAGVDAIPICLDTQDPVELVKIINNLTPSLGGINLEDISAPRCFEIEKQLIEKTDIPIFHDDQHGTAVVVLAGFINALKLTGKNIKDVKVVVNGAGAGALSVSELLLQHGVKNLVICDTKGAIYKGRAEGMNPYKELIAQKTNQENEKGLLEDIIKGADFFVGLSVGNVVTPEMVKSMATKPVVFALANPYPEIMPDIAKEAGAFIVATGRSDFKNQINNSLAFPGIFRGTLDVRAKVINNDMKIAAAKAISDLVDKNDLSTECIIPHALDLSVPPNVAKAVAAEAIKTGVAQKKADLDIIYEDTKNYLYGM